MFWALGEFAGSFAEVCLWVERRVALDPFVVHGTSQMVAVVCYKFCQGKYGLARLDSGAASWVHSTIAGT